MTACVYSVLRLVIYFMFFFNDTATTEIYTLSLHDALPISCAMLPPYGTMNFNEVYNLYKEQVICGVTAGVEDRKSTRLNSSHANISYAVFCLKKKKKPIRHIQAQKNLTTQQKRYYNLSLTL